MMTTVKIKKVKGKKKNAVNRIMIRSGHNVLVHWKCDICSRVFRTFTRM